MPIYAAKAKTIPASDKAMAQLPHFF